MTEYVYVVMTRLPHADGEFVELEDEQGRGVGSNRGIEWVERPDGLVALRIPIGGEGLLRSIIDEAFEREREHDKYHLRSHDPFCPNGCTWLENYDRLVRSKS